MVFEISGPEQIISPAKKESFMLVFYSVLIKQTP